MYTMIYKLLVAKHHLRVCHCSIYIFPTIHVCVCMTHSCISTIIPTRILVVQSQGLLIVGTSVYCCQSSVMLICGG